MNHPWHDSEEFPDQCGLCGMGKETMNDHTWSRVIDGMKTVGNGRTPEEHWNHSTYNWDKKTQKLAKKVGDEIRANEVHGRAPKEEQKTRKKRVSHKQLVDFVFGTLKKNGGVVVHRAKSVPRAPKEEHSK